MKSEERRTEKRRRKKSKVKTIIEKVEQVIFHYDVTILQLKQYFFR